MSRRSSEPSSACGGRLDLADVELPELDDIAEMNAGGGFPAAESYAWHRELIAEREADYDPRVLVRIRRGELQIAA